jgi:putative inorganic carbon (HCO3(-)) transporter
MVLMNERIARALILATALLLPAYLFRFSTLGIPTTALEILIVLSFLATVLATRSKWKFPPRPFLIAIGLFVLSALVATAIAPDKRVALGILKAWIVDPILFAWSTYQFAGEQKFVRALISVMVASGVLVSLSAIYQRLTSDLTADGRALGIYGYFPRENASPNFLALYVAPIATLAFAMALSALKTMRRASAVLFVAFLGMLSGILFSESRGGLIGIAAGSFIALLIYFREWIHARGWAKVVVALGIVASLALGWQIAKPNFALSPVEGGRVTSSNNLRWEIWKTTGEILKDKWALGVGLGNYQDYFTEFTKDRANYPEFIAPLALTPHNLFLAVWVNVGFVGLLSFLWLIWLSLRRVLINAHTPSLTLILLAALAAILVHGLVDTPYFKNDLSVLFWIVVVLLTSLGASGRLLGYSRKNGAA